MMARETVEGGTEEHEHCRGCIKIRKCTTKIREGFSCEIAECKSLCGATFHECKLSEHRLLCKLEKVPCLNKGRCVFLCIIYLLIIICICLSFWVDILLNLDLP